MERGIWVQQRQQLVGVSPEVMGNHSQINILLWSLLNLLQFFDDIVFNVDPILKLRHRFDGLGDRVRDVVELQVEKDLKAEVRDLADAVGPAGGEHLEADLHPGDGPGEALEGGSDFAGRRGVEDEDEFAGHGRKGLHQCTRIPADEK